jgi:hypothetical protein
MSFLTLTSSALALGFVHGLGADHLMAIAALATDRRNGQTRTRIVRTAIGFALGHMVVLGLGVIAAVAFGLVLPAAFASGAERLGGGLLVVLGALGLWGVISGRAYSHLHPDVGGRARWHFHFGGPHHPHGHSRIPTVLGAVFALSSLRALMLLEPFGASAEGLALPMLLLLNILFGLGILLSRSLFGVVLARVLSFGTIDTIGRVAAAGVAVASILLGVYWVG